MRISASDFKNGWHEYLDEVVQARREVIVTRYGRPVAKLVPYDEAEASRGIFGWLAGTVTVEGDIVAPSGERWDADA
ncbi:MAG TPA: type II toxin-antitoxin system Phd/YefM family antitoxin [Longimicrobiales bacterium]